MRVLFVVPRYFPATGGAELLTRELVQRLAPHHDVAVVTQWRENRTDFVEATTLGAPPAPYDDEDGDVPIHVIAPTQPARRWLGVLGRAYGRWRFSRPLFYVLYRHALLPQLIARTRSYDLVHAVHVGLVYSAEIALDAARRAGLPFVFTPFPHQGGWEGPRFRRLYRLADAVIAMTEVEKAWLSERGAPPERIHVHAAGPLLADGADAEGFRRQHRLAGPVILFLGQKFRYKGYWELLAATPAVWSRYPEARFVFIGPRTKESKGAFAAHCDPRILELGVVDLQTKTNALAACDLLCVPSVQESLGLVFLEAWAMQKPVIAGDIPIEREIVDDGRDGILVGQQPTAISEAICRLLADPATAAAMGLRGQAKVQQRYNWDTTVAGIERLYEQLVREHTRRPR